MSYQQLSLYIAWITNKNQFKLLRIIDKLGGFKYYYALLIELGLKSTMEKQDKKRYSNTMHPNNCYVKNRELCAYLKK